MKEKHTYTLHGHIEFVPLEKGFITPIFMFDSNFFAQVIDDYHKIESFELIPDEYINMIDTTSVNSEIQKKCKDNCLFGFKNVDFTFYGDYNTVRDYLKKDMLTTNYDHYLSYCVESFFNSNNYAEEEENINLGLLANEDSNSYGNKILTQISEKINKVKKLRRDPFAVFLRANDAPQWNSICHSLDPNILYNTLYYSQFHEIDKTGSLIEDESRTCSIRPFHIPTDLPEMHRWIRKYCGVDDKADVAPLTPLLETYNQLITSSNGQSFVIESNNKIIVQFDLIRPDLDLAAYKLYPGDFEIQFLYNPDMDLKYELTEFTFKAFLEFTFRYNDVNRVIVRSYALDKKSNTLIKSVGFNLLKSIRDYTGDVNIFTIEKERYLEENH
jgi:hypothetical protein